MPAPGVILAGRYRIVSPLGAGAMATVHRARDERLERDVAVKILLPNHAGDPVLASRFDREARSLAAAAHPGVVAVFDVDPGDPAAGVEPFFVMELCEGGSLADRLSGGLRLSPDELIPILISVADGLAGLHARGVVHRDVKPSNILLSPARAKLADFGLARSDDVAQLNDLTAPGTAVGTMGYLPPDVLAGATVGPPADVYALGVAAFAGLTGSMPRAAGSIAELVSSGGQPAPLVSSVAPGLGAAFDQPVARALDPDPAERPDAATFAASLTSALGEWARARPGPARMAGSGQADLDATTAVVPLPTPPVRRPPVSVNPAPGSPRSAASRRNLVAAALVGGLVVAVLALAATRAPGAGLASETSTPSAMASTASNPPASNPPASASALPTLVATPSIAERALKALDEVDAAIAASPSAPGGPKKDADDFARRAREIRSAVERGDLNAAAKEADGLAKAVSKATGGPKGQPNPALEGAVADLIDVLDDR